MHNSNGKHAVACFTFIRMENMPWHVFHSNYAFHLISQGLTVCPFAGGLFVRLTVLPLQGFEATYPIFKISMTLQTWLPDAFHHLVANDNFHC